MESNSIPCYWYCGCFWSYRFSDIWWIIRRRLFTKHGVSWSNQLLCFGAFGPWQIFGINVLARPNFYLVVNISCHYLVVSPPICLVTTYNRHKFSQVGSALIDQWVVRLVSRIGKLRALQFLGKKNFLYMFLFECITKVLKGNNIEKASLIFILSTNQIRSTFIYCKLFFV